MNPYKTTILSLLIAGAFLVAEPAVRAQGNSYGKGHAKKEHKQGGQEKYENGTHGQGKGKGKNKNKAAANKFPHSKPYSVKVPPGHYPQSGYYRIWYPGRPPGQQPAPVRNGYPANAPLTDGAFILYGDKAYDAQYDWRKEEQQKPKTIPREIIDILFPQAPSVPAQ